MDSIIFLEWNSFGNDFIKRQFKSAGYMVIDFEFPRDTEDTRSSAELTEKLTMEILKNRPNFVFSFNYFPVAAIACQACKVKYVSWVYDNPYIQMYSQTIFYDTNRVFVFDSSEVQRFQQMGARTVYYLPMAAAVEEYDQMIPSELDKKKYDCDVAFIGSMYSETKQHMFRHLEDLDQFTKGFLYGLMEAQKQVYGMDLLEPALINSKTIVESMQKVAPVYAHGDGLETVEWVFANYFLARKVTAMERVEILSKISEMKLSDGKCPNIHLYTPEPTPNMPLVKNMGKIDYYKEAPYAIKCAKINLNISLRSIHSGMPLRTLDILGCGGFLLTNFQSDFLECFVPGEDFVYYESIEQIPQLVQYYLSHEEERCKIAANGYKKVKEYLAYKDQVDKMLSMI